MAYSRRGGVVPVVLAQACDGHREPAVHGPWRVRTGRSPWGESTAHLGGVETVRCATNGQSVPVLWLSICSTGSKATEVRDAIRYGQDQLVEMTCGRTVFSPKRHLTGLSDNMYPWTPEAGFKRGETIRYEQPSIHARPCSLRLSARRIDRDRRGYGRNLCYERSETNGRAAFRRGCSAWSGADARLA